MSNFNFDPNRNIDLERRQRDEYNGPRGSQNSRMDNSRERQLQNLERHISATRRQLDVDQNNLRFLQNLLRITRNEKERESIINDIWKHEENIRRGRLMIPDLLERLRNGRIQLDMNNLGEDSPVARYYTGLGKKKREKTEWQQLVDDVRKENPHLSFKEVLLYAKRLYR